MFPLSYSFKISLRSSSASILVFLFGLSISSANMVLIGATGSLVYPMPFKCFLVTINRIRFALRNSSLMEGGPLREEEEEESVNLIVEVFKKVIDATDKERFEAILSKALKYITQFSYLYFSFRKFNKQEQDIDILNYTGANIATEAGILLYISYRSSRFTDLQELQREFDWDQKILSIARDTFNVESFRIGQRECINAALSGKDSLVLMPTGSGKSLIFQLVALYEHQVRGSVTVITAINK
jgi:hypothetical protein